MKIGSLLATLDFDRTEQTDDEVLSLLVNKYHTGDLSLSVDISPDEFLLVAIVSSRFVGDADYLPSASIMLSLRQILRNCQRSM